MPKAYESDINDRCGYADQAEGDASDLRVVGIVPAGLRGQSDHEGLIEWEVSMLHWSGRVDDVPVDRWDGSGDIHHGGRAADTAQWAAEGRRSRLPRLLRPHCAEV